jgi:hypothetical protein
MIMIDLSYQVSLGLMISGCALHETFAIVVARRNTSRVGVRENIMLITSQAEEKPKSMSQTTWKLVVRSSSVSTSSRFTDFFHFDGIDSALCREKELGQEHHSSQSA